jgi:hypothetical protein
MTQPPPLRLQISKSLSHLGLGPRAGTAPGGEAYPTAGVDRQSNHDEQKRNCQQRYIEGDRDASDCSGG